MSKYTRNAILSSFWDLLAKKSFDKITVKDIIESAQINRNTFYYHFEDIFALLDEAFKDRAIQYRKNTKEANSFYEEYVRAAGFFLDYREAIIHIYNSENREILYKYLKSATNHFVSHYVDIAAEGTELSEEGHIYVTGFYSYAIVGKTMQWVDKGMPQYDQDLLLTVSQSFEATIDIMIKDYVEHHKKSKSFDCR